MTEIAAAVLMPATVIALEVITAPRAALVTSVNVKAFGVASAATVVLVNVSDTPPMVRTVLVAVAKLAEAVCRTQTVWPLAMVPAVDTKVTVHPTEYVPPVTEIAAAALMPATVIALDVITAPGTAFITSVKVKALGVVSAAAVVLEKMSKTPPMVSAVSVCVEKLDEAVWRTQTVWPLLMVDAAVTNVAVQPME